MTNHNPYSASPLIQKTEYSFDCDYQEEQTDENLADTWHNNTSTPSDSPICEPLCSHVERVVRQYFALLDNESPTDLYGLILKEVERPLLSVVLEQTRGNQTKCAQILGLNRGTLRKKLKDHNLI